MVYAAETSIWPVTVAVALTVPVCSGVFAANAVAGKYIPAITAATNQNSVAFGMRFDNLPIAIILRFVFIA
jgi:hypothetical protein